MAAPAKQMTKPANKTDKTPRTPPTEKEMRETFSKRANRIVKNLGRESQRIEKLLRAKAAKPSDAQRAAFNKHVSAAIERLEAALRNEATGGADLIPTE